MKDLVQKKLESYASKTVEEEENALKEITQEIALFALAKSGFFQEAVFQGGTCLRIIHGLDRFSEDLDFCLRRPDPNFNLDTFLDDTKTTMKTFGYEINVSGIDKGESTMQMRFLKDESIKTQLNFAHISHLKKKIKIKVEVDRNPPDAAIVKSAFVDFPIDFSIASHDLPSLYAGKCHALLCCNYTKGRDWYDFSWYVAQSVTPNFKMLSHALNQVGPWQGKVPQVDAAWLKKQLTKRIQEITWSETAQDVARFLPQRRQETLQLWSEDFFVSKIAKMFRHLNEE